MLQQVGQGLQFIKDYNELNVLRFIKNHAPVSRADIAKKYHLSKAAVSDIISRLIAQGYVSEIGVGHSTSRGGRRPIILKFNARAGFVIAVEIKRSYAQIALLDLEAHIHELQSVTFSEGSSFQTVTDYIFPVITHFIELDWVRKAKPIGIGIGMPGIIDYAEGCVKISDTLHHWEKVPVQAVFQDRFDMHVILENDVKTYTLGECLFGQSHNCENLINLWIGDGIGAGIIINGSLIRGATASAGEIGYDELGFFIRDTREFPLLYRGQKDFGDILSNKLLLLAASEAVMTDNYSTQLKAQNLTLLSLAEAAEQADPLAYELFKEYAQILGILCINLINTLNIDTLILSGKLVSKSELLLKMVRERVRKDILREPAQAVRIIPSTLNELGVIMGAAGLVLEDIFYHKLINIQKYRSIFKECDELQN